jgi:DNA polymerase
MEDGPDKRSEALNLHEKIISCSLCPLMNRAGRTESTSGFGDLDAPVMIIGQSLHTIHERFRIQIPFVNPRGMTNSGNLLFTTLWETKINLWDIFISNIVHCHPPKNRPSNSNEKRNCKPFILSEIGIVNPKLIIGLGADATKFLMGGNITLPTSHRKEIKTPYGVWTGRVVGMKHPASFLYSPSKEGESNWKVQLFKFLERYY